MLPAWGCGNVIHSHNAISKIKWTAGVDLISTRLLITIFPQGPSVIEAWQPSLVAPGDATQT